MVSLRLADTPDSSRCGGTLVEADVVLTASALRRGGAARRDRGRPGADMPTGRAPRGRHAGHAVPATFDLSVDNRDDACKVVLLATPQSTPTVAATPRAAGRRPHGDDRLGLHQRPSGLRGDDRPAGEPPGGDRRGGLVRHGRVLDPAALPRTDDDLHRGSPGPLDDQPQGLGRPVARPWPMWCGARQVGVTSLGADSTTRLCAGFTSIPVEAGWITEAVGVPASFKAM